MRNGEHNADEAPQEWAYPALPGGMIDRNTAAYHRLIQQGYQIGLAIVERSHDSGRSCVFQCVVTYPNGEQRKMRGGYAGCPVDIAQAVEFYDAKAVGNA